MPEHERLLGESTQKKTYHVCRIHINNCWCEREPGIKHKKCNCCTSMHILRASDFSPDQPIVSILRSAPLLPFTSSLRHGSDGCTDIYRIVPRPVACRKRGNRYRRGPHRAHGGARGALLLPGPARGRPAAKSPDGGRPGVRSPLGGCTAEGRAAGTRRRGVVANRVGRGRGQR